MIKYIIIKYNMFLNIEFINIIKLPIDNFETYDGIIFLSIIYLLFLLI